MIEVATACVIPAGLDGDRHSSPGKRAVTLVQTEHLPVISALAGNEARLPLLRRNLAISGINLAALRGIEIRVGQGVRLRIMGPCAPCSRMEEVLGPGGYNAMRHHGGWCAEVLTVGAIAVGDEVATTATADGPTTPNTFLG